MWRDEVLALVAARSAPGAGAATFTVAGQVRRGLAAAGFEVAKAPGFGRKRERLNARLPGAARRAARRRGASPSSAPASPARRPARAVRALGGEAAGVRRRGPRRRRLGQSRRPGDAAPGRRPRPSPPSCSPRPSAAPWRSTRPARARSSPAAPCSSPSQPRDAGRFAKIAASDLFEPGALATLTPAEATARRRRGRAAGAGPARRPGDRARARCWPPGRRRSARPRSPGIEPDGDGWRLLDADGAVLATADAVIVAAGLASGDLVAGPAAQRRARPGELDGARRSAAGRGLRRLCDPDPRRRAVRRHPRPRRHRPRPARRGPPPQPGDPGRRACRAWPRGWPAGRWRAAPRSASPTPDHLPLAGAAPDGAAGLFVLGGFGARGFTLAPLLAEHVAALALGAPSPLPAPLAAFVDPARFARRAARRGS